jgi:hypothetical protein
MDCEILLILAGFNKIIDTIDLIEKLSALKNKLEKIGKKIGMVYIGKENDPLSSLFDFDLCLSIGISEINKSQKIMNLISLSQYYEQMSLQQYTYFWGGLYRFFEYYKEQHPNYYIEDKDQVICSLNINYLSESITKEMVCTINKVIEEKNNVYENIYIYDDYLSIGTYRVMLYYMLMYKYYGSYDCDHHMRLSLNTKYQLFKHISNFSNFILTRLSMKNAIVEKEKMVILSKNNDQFNTTEISRGFNEIGYRTMILTDETLLTEKIVKINPKCVLLLDVEIDLEYLKSLTKSPMIIIYCDSINRQSLILNDVDLIFSNKIEFVERNKNSYFMHLGYSHKIYRPISLTQYSFDISLFIYGNSKVMEDFSINFINNLYHNQTTYGYKLALFGSNEIKNDYPLSYYEIPDNEKKTMIINGSRINVCIGRLNGSDLFIIMGCGGLLYIDQIVDLKRDLNRDLKRDLKGDIKHMFNCILINKKNYMRQIEHILAHYDSYDHIKKNAVITSRNYSWNDWVYKINETIIKYNKSIYEDS